MSPFSENAFIFDERQTKAIGTSPQPQPRFSHMHKNVIFGLAFYLQNVTNDTARKKSLKRPECRIATALIKIIYQRIQNF